MHFVQKWIHYNSICQCHTTVGGRNLHGQYDKNEPNIYDLMTECTECVECIKYIACILDILDTLDILNISDTFDILGKLGILDILYIKENIPPVKLIN